MDIEPKTITDGEGRCFAREDEMPAAGNIFYAAELSGGGKGEEVDAAKDSRRKIEEEDGRRKGVGHD